jgi:GNAT superfamily N-acetyltransferase
MIRSCAPEEFDQILSVINDASVAYRGVIPNDRWNDPYMSAGELRTQIEEGVIFWCYEEEGEILGVMGIQDKKDYTLIRHAYVRTNARKKGIGTKLLNHLLGLALTPVLVGTWADAYWAVSFYEKNGFRLVTPEKKDYLLAKYWSIPARQIATSVVLASINNNFE